MVQQFTKDGYMRSPQVHISRSHRSAQPLTMAAAGWAGAVARAESVTNRREGQHDVHVCLASKSLTELLGVPAHAQHSSRRLHSAKIGAEDVGFCWRNAGLQAKHPESTRPRKPSALVPPAGMQLGMLA